MPFFKTLKEAEKYGEKHCFTPIIKERKNKITDEFLGFTVIDEWDVKNGMGQNRESYNI